MIRRVLVVVAALAALTVVPSVRAQDSARSEDKAAKLKEDLALQQQNLARRFGDFQQQLLRLQQRLEKSPRKEDQDKALVLKKALERAQDALISTQFDSLVDYLKNQKFTKVGEIKAAHERTLKLADDLREVLALLNENSRSLQLREERLRLEEMLKRLERIIHDQKVARTINEINQDPKTAKNAQTQVTKATEKLVRDIPGKDGKGGEAKQAKGENKDGGKGEGKKGEGKDAGKSADSKKGEGKDGGKAGKDGDGKKGEAKAGDPKSGPKTAKAGDKTGAAKSSKGGEAKAGDSKSGKSGDGKPGEAKSGKAGDGKKGEAKSGAKGDEKKPGEAKTGPKIRTKEEEKKPGEAKSNKGDGKQGDAKSSKGGEAKSADSKSGGKSESKQGEAKAGSKSSGKGQAKSNGTPPPDQPPASSKKGGDDDGKKQPPQPPSGPQDDTAQAKKRIKEAGYDQHRAEDNIDKGDKKASKKDQDDAVQKLEDAKKKLEDLLRQLREEELDRLLANLQARCEKMLAMQINVQDGTTRVAKEIAKTEDKKATRDHQQDSLKLSDKEKDIVVEATKAIEMLEAEGSAVAFPEVFQQVREDMKSVQRRLGIVDVGKVTQGVEQDIVDTLKEMIEALKKAKQELDNKKSQSKPGQSGPPPDQKLLDEIAELKMIRSMQIRVNGRTRLYGREYEGEQADAPRIQQELRQLSDRQDRIFEVTNRIAKGDNR